MTWFPCCLQAYIWFVQFWMVCGNCCQCKCTTCKCLAVPIGVKSNAKDILNDGRKNNKNNNNINNNQHDPLQGHGGGAMGMGAFGFGFGGFDDGDDWMVHRGHAANMELSFNDFHIISTLCVFCCL